MAEYRTVRMGFWNDPYIEGLDAKAKLLYLYLFTGPYANNLGVIEVTRRKIAYETSLSPQDVDKYLADFEACGKVVCDPGHNLIFLTRFIRHQTSTSPKILQGLKSLTLSIPSPVIAKAICIRYPQVYGIDSYPTDTISIPYADGMYTVDIPSAEFGSWKLEDGKGKVEGGSGNTRARAGKPSEPDKLRFGENGNVRLTQAQHDSLCAKFGPEPTAKAIALLDLHIGAKGKDEYKDHNLALQKWVFDAVKEREARQARASPPGRNRTGMSAHGNTNAGGQERNYGQSVIPDWAGGDNPAGGGENDAGR